MLSGGGLILMLLMGGAEVRIMLVDLVVTAYSSGGTTETEGEKGMIDGSELDGDDHNTIILLLAGIPHSHTSDIGRVDQPGVVLAGPFLSTRRKKSVTIPSYRSWPIRHV